MSNLRHFELDTEGSMDLINGKQWTLIVSKLLIFDFRIQLHFHPFLSFIQQSILPSFRSLFRVEQKRWFVAYDGLSTQQIFTVPRFISNMVKYPSNNWPTLCTSPNFSLHPHIKYLHVSSLNPIPDRFTNITSLSFDIDEIPNNNVILAFMNHLEQMHFLHSLSFRNISI